jgi:two-component system, chemotaxis family, CheB/CheR fusion protein
VEALHGLFTGTRPGTGIAYVIVLHLAPGHRSLLPEILGRWTALPVVSVEDGMTLAPDQVYVAPPGSAVTLTGTTLHLHEADRTHVPAVIDTLFGSLAESQGERAAGIVLSGTGSDGSLGLKAIKERGGLTIAQGSVEPPSDKADGPQYSGMPASAIATGVVDLVLPVGAIAARLAEMLAMRTGIAGDEASRTEATEEARRAICAILRDRVGHDFSNYKRQTFLRRVQRRMQVRRIISLSAFVGYLHGHEDEVVLLFRDLLIGVTSFFRDGETFDALETTVIPRLFEGKGRDDTVRVWVPGCATGEEAYSLGILLREHMDTLNDPPKVQVFGTDIDDAAIGVARAGRYPTLLLSSIPEARRKRFFVAGQGNFAVAKELRELCTFSSHSIIRDPPFSRIDMVSCRNLLIYMNIELQAQLFPVFHYALVPGGILVLGSSETVARHAELFSAIDKKNRIFARRDAPSPILAVPGILPRSRVLTAGLSYSPDGLSGWATTARIAVARVLERYTPVFVVVNPEGDVIHYSARTGRYLEAPAGAPSRSLLGMARRGLHADLRVALRRTAETGQTTEINNVFVDTDAGRQAVTLTVEKLVNPGGDRPDGEPRYLVVFTELATLPPGAEPARSDASEQIERELRDLREQYQSTAEEYETALEELKSANEELHSVNEELQSSNEELETSKEEMQSMNEELQAVNLQLAGKLDELDRANSDLRNLFESTEVATIFLDRQMIIRAFTPAVVGIYNLIRSDQGRPLSDIASQIDAPELEADLAEVLGRQTPVERRVSRRDGRAHYLMRIVPYRGTNNTIDGALLSFVEVTTIVEAAEHQKVLINELNHRVKNMLTVVISIANQTLRRSDSLETFAEAFQGRVHALSAAYALLSRENWTDVRLRDVIFEELAPYFPAATLGGLCEGPAILLRPSGALSVGLVIHELATNAVKYGALSVPSGRISIRWEVDSERERPALVLRWKEHDGPPVKPPSGNGFGMKLIERGIGRELGGKTVFDYAADGLEVTLTIPLDPEILLPAAGQERAPS